MSDFGYVTAKRLIKIKSEMERLGRPLEYLEVTPIEFQHLQGLTSPMKPATPGLPEMFLGLPVRIKYDTD